MIVEKYVSNLKTDKIVVPDSKEEEAIKIIRENTKLGMIFVQPVSRAIEISSGKEGDEVI